MRHGRARACVCACACVCVCPCVRARAHGLAQVRARPRVHVVCELGRGTATSMKVSEHFRATGCHPPRRAHGPHDSSFSYTDTHTNAAALCCAGQCTAGSSQQSRTPPAPLHRGDVTSSPAPARQLEGTAATLRSVHPVLQGSVRGCAAVLHAGASQQASNVVVVRRSDVFVGPGAATPLRACAKHDSLCRGQGYREGYSRASLHVPAPPVPSPWQAPRCRPMLGTAERRSGITLLYRVTL